MDDVRQVLDLHGKGILSPDSALRAIAKVADTSATARSAPKRRRLDASASPAPTVLPTASAPVTPAATAAPVKKKQKTLAAWGAKVFNKTAGGERFEVKIPDEARKAEPAPVQCPWCDETFKSVQALGSHKKFAHKVAYDAVIRQGTASIQQGDGNVELDVVNATYLLIGKLESQVGKWCGATKLNSRTGKREQYSGDKQKKQQGQAFRICSPLWLVKKAILLADKLKEDGVPDPQAAAADACCLSKAAMSRYMKAEKRSEIMEACKSRKEARRCGAKRKVQDKFELATKEVLEKFKERRARGIRVGPRWLRANMLRAVKHHYPSMARTFRCSQGFMSSWRKKQKIVTRRRTNTKKKDPKVVEPLLRRMHAKFKKLIKTPFDKDSQFTFHDKEGRYLLKCRFSIDQDCLCSLCLHLTSPWQVPLERFNGGKTTYEFRGADRVQIRQNGDSDEKRFATRQVTVRAVKKGKGQPRLTLIFRGKGLRISMEEKKQWDKRVLVTFQPKAWADRNWCMEWAATEFKRIIDEFVPPNHRAVPILDNLDGQSTPEFRNLLQTKCRSDPFYGQGGATDMWQVVDDGIGHMCKNEMSEVLDEKLGDDKFYEMWSSGTMSASNARILVTQLAGEAWERVQRRLDCEHIFINKGWGMKVGNENDKLKINGLPDYTWCEKDGESSGDEEEDNEEGVEEEGEPEELVEAADDSEDDGDDDTRIAGVSSDESESESEEDEIDPGAWTDTDMWVGVSTYIKPKPKLNIAHKFMTKTGWEIGVIKKKSGRFWTVKYPSELDPYQHELNKEEYGAQEAWLVVQPK